MSPTKREMQGGNRLRNVDSWPGKSPAAWARAIAVYAGAGVFMALLNPFGSVEGVTFPMAALYWVLMIVWGGVVGEVVGWGISRLWPGLNIWLSIAALTVPQTALIVPFVLAVEEVVMRREVMQDNLLELVFFVFLVVAAGGVIRVLVVRAFTKPDPEAAAVPAPPLKAPASFLDRLPVKFRTGDLWAVSSEDHYLRVHTSLGETLILMRLTDAIREIGALDGLQTHRGWWVAKQGLADVVKGDGKLLLKLKSGAEAPVSRTYQPAVKAAGWL